MTRRDRIAHSFNRASATYDTAAQLQLLTAQALAAQVMGQDWDHPAVLEIGCGTGGLTQLLLPRIPGAWMITDIAPAMVDAARNRFKNTPAEFRVMDGEAPELGPSRFDLIVSSLAMQWFDDLPNALKRLSASLTPGGHLMMATLGQASLHEWQRAVATTGYTSGTPKYPTIDHLAGYLPGSTVHSKLLTMTYGSGAEFLKSLKSIGATTPLLGYKPLPTPILRQAMDRLGAPCTISYEILLFDWVAS